MVVDISGPAKWRLKLMAAERGLGVTNSDCPSPDQKTKRLPLGNPMAGLTSEVVRTLVVWCPDWPLTSLGVDPKRPAVVLNGDRVRASSLSARLAGISLGQRRHDAQAQCPDLIILESNEAQEVCKFESPTPWKVYV